ncbi:MAG: hypothetical protein ACFFCZ_28580 [Promethearchaeota archaeon]
MSQPQITKKCEEYLRKILKEEGLDNFFENAKSILSKPPCQINLTPVQEDFIKEQIPKSGEYQDLTINLIVIILGYEPPPNDK